MTEKLQIVSIDRKSGISSKNGKPYVLTNVQDGFSGRKGAAFGDWANDWKIGDEIEVTWVEGDEYKGVKQWRIDNPNQKPRAAGGNQSTYSAPAAAASNAVVAYQIAAELAPLFFDAKKTKLTEVTKLAKSVLKEIESMEGAATPAPAPKPAEKMPEPTQTSDGLEEDLEEDDELF